MATRSDMPDVLKKILARKSEEVSERSQALDLKTLRREARQAAAPRGFLRALRDQNQLGRPGVIAEIKKASPSKGLLRADFKPADIARSYDAGGACCLSVLTDQDFFQGHDLFLREARDACALPVLRKDFVISTYQIWESRLLGADCVLLILSALSDSHLAELNHLARDLGMDVLLEVHDERELERALALQPDMLGINNRNLHTFETDIGITLRLLPSVPEGTLLVTESGFATREEVADMRAAGVHSFLVGESFMRAHDPGEKVRDMFF